MVIDHIDVLRHIRQHREPKIVLEMSWKCPGNVLEFHSIKSVGTL